jgi:hypothetical protein
MDIVENLKSFSNIFNYKALFILYLIIAANFLAQTFGCKTQNLLNHNMYAKHLIGFFTLFVFVLLSSPIDSKVDSDNIYFKKIGASIILYILFLFSTRTKGIYFNIFLSLIGLNYILNTYADSLNKDKHKEKIEKIKLYAKYCGRLSIVVLVFGVIIYFKEKKIEYGSDFKLKKFIIGNVECKNN